MVDRLSIKIIGIIFVLSLIIFASMSYFQINMYGQDIQEAYVERAKAVALSLDANLESKEVLKDEAQLKLTIQKHIWLDSDILDITFNVMQDDGSFKSVNQKSSSIVKEGDDGFTALKEAYSKDLVLREVNVVRGKKVLTVITPIHLYGKVEGVFGIDFTLEKVDEKVSSAITTVLISYFVMMFIFVIVLFFYLRKTIVKRVLDVSHGMKEITQINFDHNINVKAKDELGDLELSYTQLQEFIKAIIKQRQESESKKSKSKK